MDSLLTNSLTPAYFISGILIAAAMISQSGKPEKDVNPYDTIRQLRGALSSSQNASGRLVKDDRKGKEENEALKNENQHLKQILKSYELERSLRQRKR